MTRALLVLGLLTLGFSSGAAKATELSHKSPPSHKSAAAHENSPTPKGASPAGSAQARKSASAHKTAPPRHATTAHASTPARKAPSTRRPTTARTSTPAHKTASARPGTSAHKKAAATRKTATTRKTTAARPSRSHKTATARKTASASGRTPASANAPAHKRPVGALIAQHATRYQVPERLVRRIIAKESQFNPRARNGPFIGLMQIRLDTARGMGYRGSAADLLDPDTNLRYGVAYLANAYRVAHRDEDAAIRLYQRGYYFEAKRKGMVGELIAAR